MISVVILTRNEEEFIETCLKSVNWADEIVIIDEGSTDKTVEIAKKYTDKIYIEKSNDFSLRRNLGMEKSSGDWVLYVDADERVMKDLKDEVLNLVEKGEKNAYAISRKTIIFGEEKRYGVFWPSWMIRLLKRSDFQQWVGQVHEHPEFKGDLGYTKNSLVHLTHRDVDQIVLKSLEWSNIDAKLRLDANHPKMTGWRFLRIFFSEIYIQGIKQKGFFNGTVGIMDSLLQVFSLYITYVRLWQLQQSKSMKKTYEDIDESLIKNNFERYES